MSENQDKQDCGCSFGHQGMSLVDRLGTYLSRRAVMRWLPRKGLLRVLDIGCGYNAQLLCCLKDRLEAGVGVDRNISPEAKRIEKLSFVEAEIEEVLPAITDSSQDAVFLLSVLEHLHDPATTLRGIIRVLRPGGVLMINVPTWIGKRFLEFSAFRLRQSGTFEIEDHKMYYNIPDLWPLLVQAGFKPSSIKLYYHKFGLNLFGICTK